MKVSTIENIQDVHHPVTLEIMGQVITRVYQGENVQRHSFHTTDREFRLGPTTDAFKFIDWPEVFEPVMQRGYEVENLTVSRGGLKIHAVLSNPTGPLYDDPVNWDQTIWGGSTGLRDSVIISGGIRPGSGFHFNRGFFRMVCSNGLVLETVGLGKARFSHLHFNPETLAEALFKTTSIGDQIISGSKIGTMKGLQKSLEIINRVSEDEEAARENLPPFIAELVEPLVALPKRFQSEANVQFEALVKGAHRKEVFELDIANALTSAQNRLDNAPTRLAFKLLPAQRNLIKLTGVFSL